MDVERDLAYPQLWPENEEKKIQTTATNLPSGLKATEVMPSLGPTSSFPRVNRHWEKVRGKTQICCLGKNGSNYPQKTPPKFSDFAWWEIFSQNVPRIVYSNYFDSNSKKIIQRNLTLPVSTSQILALLSPLPDTK